MKGNIKKSIINCGKAILKSTPFLVVWYNILLVMAVIDSEGGMAIYKDAFGENFVWIVRVLLIVVIASIFYLRIFIKKEYLIQLLSFLSAALLVLILVIAGNIGRKKFDDFSGVKWRDFPTQRINMFNDLKEQYSLKGYTTDQIEAFLGEPDVVSDKGTYIYDDRHNNAVYVEFVDGVVYDVYYTD